MRVVVAGSSTLRRAAFTRLLEDAEIVVAGEAADAAELLRKVRAHHPDVVVAELPVCAEALRTLRRELPDAGTLLISETVSADHAAALLEGGAAGVGYLIEGQTSVARFVAAVRDVAARGSVVDPEVITRVLSRGRSDLGELSARESEVLAQMATGASNRGIARQMFLSERAIERHVSGIFDALGISAARAVNRRVLAVRAYLAGAEPV